MGECAILAICLVVFFAVLMSFDYRDGIKFPCMFASDRESKREPNFVYSSEVETFVNRSGAVCVEDIVTFVNKRRMGKDGEVGTKDDTMTLEEQVSMLSAMLEANFHGGFWVNTPWTLNYDESGQTWAKLLYADGDEYLMISGSRTGYSGLINEPHVTKSFFGLEGALRLQRRAPHRPVLIAPLLSRRGVEARVEPVGSEGELWTSGFRIRKGQKVLFSTESQSEGAVVLQYAYGSKPSATLWSFILPPLFKAFDWETSFTYLRALGESFYRNGILPAVAFMVDKEDAWSARMNLSYRSESEQSYTYDAEREEEETGEDTALAEAHGLKELQEAGAPAKAAASDGKAKANPPPATGEARKEDKNEEQDLEDEEDEEPLARDEEL
ncbi:putative transmembrane protein [Toxoplasma gondii TgCatPRC2]|uniref:Putative transmembrane protein n=1 Tax=Toxoplasma gondii TgCatPRC2 TaxID=1130821 RepID=A0A151HGC7_TOXGO|nr:putative transmembrane protein [Toxoplasma gondii TgCatPRC2]